MFLAPIIGIALSTSLSGAMTAGLGALGIGAAGTTAAGAGAALGTTAGMAASAAAFTGTTSGFTVGALTSGATAASVSAGTAATAAMTTGEMLAAGQMGLSLVGAGMSMFPGQTPDQPAIEEATAIPTQDADKIMRSKQASVLQQRQRGGRNSTLLSSSDGDSLGGGL